MPRSDTDVECLTVEGGPEPEKSSAQGRVPPQHPNIVDFDGPDDPDNPLNWSTTRKMTSILIVSLTALLS